MHTFAARAGRNLALNLTVALAVGVGVFALHVNTPRHTPPHAHENVVAPQWTPMAAHPMSTARVNGDLCSSRGSTNYYVHHWQTVHPRQILNSPFIFGEHRCKVNGFRLYKSSSDTRGEVKFARHFLATDRPKKPTIFCQTTPHHAYFLDLAFYWADIDPLNAAERHHYTRWAHAYAAQHGCRLFLP